MCECDVGLANIFYTLKYFIFFHLNWVDVKNEINNI